MKKKIVVLLCTLSAVGMLLVGCGETTGTIYSEVTTEKTTGSYSLFRTKDVQEYLNFLETFDETKYEIVDISTSMYTTAHDGSGEFYIVTYRTK